MQYGPKIATNGLVLALDAADMNSYSPNVHPNPTDIYAWAINGGSTSCTITRDSSQTRQYGSKPMKMAVTGNDPYIITVNYGPGASSIWNLAPAVNGQTWTISVYVKASVATTGELFLFPVDSNGVVITYGFGAINITTSWTRVSYTYTISSANCAYIQCRLDGPNTGGSGIDIWWDGLQVERASSATQFNPYYYGNTVWRDFSRNNGICTLVGGPVFDTVNKGTIYFDGGTAYCAISPSNNFAWTPSGIGLNNMTLDLWIKTSDSTAGQYILAKPWNANGEYNYYIQHNYFNLNVGAGSGGFGFTSIATGNWTNLVIAVSSTQFGSYINGILNNAFTNHGITINTPTNGNAGTELALMTLYPYGGGGNSSFSVQGNVGSFRIYNRILTATEALQNYRASKGKFGL